MCRDPGPDVHSDAGDLVARHLTLAGVDAGPNGEPQTMQPGDDVLRASHRPSRSVKGGKEAVPGGVDLRAPEAREVLAHESTVAFEQGVPGAVAELSGQV